MSNITCLLFKMEEENRRQKQVGVGSRGGFLILTWQVSETVQMSQCVGFGDDIASVLKYFSLFFWGTKEFIRIPTVAM